MDGTEVYHYGVFVDFERLLHFLSFFSIFLVIAVLNYSMAVYRNLCE